MLRPGDVIKKTRTEKKVSIRSLSNLSGVSHTEISKIESGERINPNPNILLKLADTLNLDYNYLLKLSGYIPDNSSIKNCVYDSSRHLYDDFEGNTTDFILFKDKVVDLVSKDINRDFGVNVKFNENYMINSKVYFDFIGFGDDVSVYCLSLDRVCCVDSINIHSIKSTFADFYFNFRHTFDDYNIHFISIFIVDDMVCFDELDRVLKNYFNHFRPNFRYIIYLVDDLK